ncbi:MAG: hypothetical protein WCK65_05645 [Rhodospirillaceae bacterium]
MTQLRTGRRLVLVTTILTKLRKDAFYREGKATLAGRAGMRCRDKQSCQNWYELELKQAGERLEHLRSGLRRLRSDLRPDWERRLDDARGRLNRSLARLEALRRCNGENWRAAAAQADDAYIALIDGLDLIDISMAVRSLAA